MERTKKKQYPVKKIWAVITTDGHLVPFKKIISLDLNPDNKGNYLVHIGMGEDLACYRLDKEQAEHYLKSICWASKDEVKSEIKDLLQ